MQTAPSHNPFTAIEIVHKVWLPRVSVKQRSRARKKKKQCDMGVVCDWYTFWGLDHFASLLAFAEPEILEDKHGETYMNLGIYLLFSFWWFEAPGASSTSHCHIRVNYGIFSTQRHCIKPTKKWLGWFGNWLAVRWHSNALQASGGIACTEQCWKIKASHQCLKRVGGENSQITKKNGFNQRPCVQKKLQLIHRQKIVWFERTSNKCTSSFVTFDLSTLFF